MNKKNIIIVSILVVIASIIVAVFGFINHKKNEEYEAKAQFEKEYQVIFNKGLGDLSNSKSYNIVETSSKIKSENDKESVITEYVVLLGDNIIGSFKNENNETFYFDNEYIYLSVYDIWHKKQQEYTTPHEIISLFKDLEGTKEISEEEKSFKILSFNSTKIEDLFNILKQTNSYNNLDEESLKLLSDTLEKDIEKWGYTLKVNSSNNSLVEFNFIMKHKDKTENHITYEVLSTNKHNEFVIPNEIKDSARLVLDPLEEMKKRLNPNQEELPEIVTEEDSQQQDSTVESES